MSAWPQFNSIQWLASALMFVLFLYSLRQKQQRISLPLSVFIGLTLVWCLCAASFPLLPDLESKIFLNRIKMVAASLVSLSLCWFAAAIYGELKVSRWVWWVASLVPAISVLLTLSPYHHLLIRDYAIRELQDGQLFVFSNGPWFPVHSLIARLLIIAAIFFLWQGMKSLHAFHRTRNKLIILSIVLPSLLDTVAVYLYPELRFIQIVPTALAFSSIVLVYVVFGHKTLEIIPFARAKIVDQMPDPCLMWDLNGKLLDYNPAAQKYFELSSENIGVYVDQIPGLPLDVRSSYPWTNSLEIELHDTCFFAECRPVRYKQGEVIGTILIFKDVSGQKRVERELRSLNQVKTTFMGILAHDLVGNISTIANTSEVLIREHAKMPADDVLANLESIQSGARDMNEFILQLADWARTQFRTLQVEKSVLEMRSTVLKVVEYLRPLSVEKELNLHVLIPETCLVRADARMIETVLRNLLANSIKHGPTGSEIKVTVTDAGHLLKFSVCDQGKNLEVMQLNSFFQDTTAEVSTANFGTQGLGLLLCRSFIRLHQTNIWAEKMTDGTSAIHFHLDKEKV